ncbi:MAG: hypothetical protein H6774_02605 [Pseudomonadales bacterium]|nr:hypothetical protein [Candidatus Woesebacteria bacterium]MCB9801955.1 hypothetical protein [Pseudomonadales bacterium]
MSRQMTPADFPVIFKKERVTFRSMRVVNGSFGLFAVIGVTLLFFEPFAGTLTILLATLARVFVQSLRSSPLRTSLTIKKEGIIYKQPQRLEKEYAWSAVDSFEYKKYFLLDYGYIFIHLKENQPTTRLEKLIYWAIQSRLDVIKNYFSISDADLLELLKTSHQLFAHEKN